MNEKEIQKIKMYSMVFFVFRFIMIFFISYQTLGNFWNEINSETFIHLSILALYLLAATMVPIKRKAIYLDTIMIIGLVLWFGEGALLSLFVFPLAKSIIVKLEMIDMFIVPIFLFVMIFFSFGWNSITIAFSIGLFAFFFIKEFETLEKNKMMKKMRTAISKKEDKLQEQEAEMLIKDKEIENITKMFIQLKHLNKKISIEELITDLVESPKQLFNAEYVGLYIFDEENYKLLKQTGNKRRYNISKELPLDAGEEEEISNDFMRYPITFENKPWGVVDVYGKKEAIYENGQKIASRFNEDDYEKIALYVDQVLFSMEHAKTLNKLEEMANNDFLTKIPNRRYFFDKFEYLIKRAKRGEELALIILDIDHFKKFNDNYGHEKGDETLIVVAEVLQSYVREIDFVGRLGGEEFGVLLPNPGNKALEIGERLRKRVSQVPFVETITVSMGVAYFGKDGTTANELYNNADKALYHAKENGRNRISEYGEI